MFFFEFDLLVASICRFGLLILFGLIFYLICLFIQLDACAREINCIQYDLQLCRIRVFLSVFFFPLSPLLMCDVLFKVLVQIYTTQNEEEMWSFKSLVRASIMFAIFYLLKHENIGRNIISVLQMWNMSIRQMMVTMYFFVCLALGNLQKSDFTGERDIFSAIIRMMVV